MHIPARSIFSGALASAVLLGVYFGVLTLVSGPGFAQSQFSSFWYFIVSLAVGFGVQVGLYSHLKRLVADGSGRVLGVTGTTSTAAMISCCAHYLVNVLPVLGAVGVASFVAAYQRELFWAGILFNLLGIAYLLRKVFAVKRMHMQST